MRKTSFSNITIFTCVVFLAFLSIIIFTSEQAKADAYDGEDLALAILKDESTLLSSSYIDMDQSGHRQSGVFSSLGPIVPTDQDTFALFSTGIAGYNPVTTYEENPGDERGTWFRNKMGNPRDSATLTMTLRVPLYMHYLCYHVQFLSAEYPEFIGTKYNDKLTITVNSPSQGISVFEFDVNNGYFVLDSNDIPDTGFDIFAQSGNPAQVDVVDTTPRTPGADAGASDLIPIGGDTHPVSPGEQINVTIHVQDVGDNMFDSAAFIDNLRFSGEARTHIVGCKEYEDLNGGEIECNDILEYTVTLSNTGSADQGDNSGDEFEDYIPKNTTYVIDSAYSEYGNISYDSVENKITWNGNIPAETSRILKFQVKIDNGLSNGVIISNQGTIYWDSNESGTNDAIELTDDMYADDGIDQDEDGDTDDDDPTIGIVYAFDFPTVITEDFSDDTPGGNATQYFLSRKWFYTGETDLCGSCFEVAPSYYYSTTQSFKTKLRQFLGPQYWYYSLSNLENAEMEWWEIWFACGDTSENYSFSFKLQDDEELDIAKIKFNYTQIGNKPMDWWLNISFCDSDVNDSWCELSSDYYQGYLRNCWYKLRIEKNLASGIDYTLSRIRREGLDFATGGDLTGSFGDLKRIEWICEMTPDPWVCPMFFWDEHRIGLSYPT
jgi:uncharacterized repeat protein (TIGR01451 family)